MAKSTTTRSAETKTSATKTATAAKTASAAAKTAVAAASTPDLKVVDETVPSVTGPELKKKELIDLVVERSGLKKKDVKPVVESVMAVLGEALGAGREMNLQPLGKIKVNKIKNVNNGKVVITRIRQSTGTVEAAEKDPLAEAEE
ncbi:DNA-binding protein [Pseudooceanicola sp. 216_PA32_1]|uniref:DNA-binding protein n=1 Tax=Pseudooceanicola pacificus TaxID=2676438 RepID=A0A844W371_9RHOB|nr:HU family DNA-binding protein [Pseudooceanicola pacificus]MWB78626.1 DNA-binding protein [Pseudooceanicola pacificus]